MFFDDFLGISKEGIRYDMVRPGEFAGFGLLKVQYFKGA